MILRIPGLDQLPGGTPITDRAFVSNIFGRITAKATQAAQAAQGEPQDALGSPAGRTVLAGGYSAGWLSAPV